MQIWLKLSLMVETLPYRQLKFERLTFGKSLFGETFVGSVNQIRLDATMTQNVVTYTVIVDADVHALAIDDPVNLRFLPTEQGLQALAFTTPAAGAGTSSTTLYWVAEAKIVAHVDIGINRVVANLPTDCACPHCHGGQRHGAAQHACGVVPPQRPRHLALHRG